jgi:hypothetical protein
MKGFRALRALRQRALPPAASGRGNRNTRVATANPVPERNADGTARGLKRALGILAKSRIMAKRLP